MSIISWQTFAADERYATTLAALAAIGVDAAHPPEQLRTIDLAELADSPRSLTLTLALNDERVALLAPAGIVAWLQRREPGPGYLAVGIHLEPGLTELIAASFRTMAEPAYEPSWQGATMAWSEEHTVPSWSSEPIGSAWDPATLLPVVLVRIEPEFLADLQLPDEVGPFDGAGDGLGAGDAAADADVGAAEAETDVGAAEAEAGPEAEMRVEPPGPTIAATAGARMPTRVRTAVPFTVEIALDGPDAPRREDFQQLMPVRLEPDERITVKLLRMRNVVTPEGEFDELDFPVPGRDEQQTRSMRLLAPIPGRVEVHLRFRQGETTLGLLKLTATAGADLDDAPSRDDRPLVARPERDRTLEISVGTGGTPEALDIDFEWRTLGGTEAWRVTLDRDSLLAELFDDVEAAWQAALAAHPDAPSKRDRAFAAQVRERGERMFAQFLPAELQERLRTDPDGFEGLTIVTNEPRIPWEILCVPGESERMLSEFGLVRALSGVVTRSAISIDAGGLRFLAPDYSGVEPPLQELPSIVAERDYLVTNLRAVPVQPATLGDLAALLGARHFGLFHFAGHGAASETDAQRQVILLPGPGAGSPPDRFGSDDLEQALREAGADADEHGRVVVLNACHAGSLWSETSGFASAFLRGGVDVFAGSQWSVPDSSAAFFASSFYEQLRHSLPVHEAARVARAAARANGDTGWAAYAVYAEPDAVVSFP
ncbi:CHAT domain-containing protein [Microbacteriaceae bacterium VKM Ac-2854]|nr:CHAT domain-containing protein [Microbacteriaceae bacterium VKM Ac-2854]